MSDPVTDYDVVVFNASIFLCVMAVFMVKDIEKMMNWSSLNVTIPDLTDIYVQFSSVAQSCPTLCDPMNRSISTPQIVAVICVYIVMKMEKEMATHFSFLPGESQGQGSLVGCCLWGRTESDTTEAT